MKKSNKFIEFLRKRGFYTALFTCMFGIMAISAVVSIKNITDAGKSRINTQAEDTGGVAGKNATEMDLAAVGAQITKPLSLIANQTLTDDDNEIAAGSNQNAKPGVDIKNDGEQKTGTTPSSKTETSTEQKTDAKSDINSEKEDNKEQPKTQESSSGNEEIKKDNDNKQEEIKQNTTTTNTANPTNKEENKETPKKEDADKADATTESVSPNASFADSDKMNWPLDGAVVMEYSMDHAIFDKTLNQYRTNPSICISANVGTQVKAAATGVVLSVYDDHVLGKTVVVDHGNGWSTTYGQLQDNVLVAVGQDVEAGTVLGGVGNPSKYGILLGSHLNFKITKDDEPMDPTVVLSN